MRVAYTNSLQAGKGFYGYPTQRGFGLGNVFRGILRTVLPVAKSAGKALGREALHTGAKIASDVVSGLPLAKTTKLNVRRGTARLLKKGANRLQRGGRKRLGRRQVGGRKRRQKGGRKRKRKQIGGRQRGGKLGKRSTTIKAVRRVKKRPRKRKNDALGSYYE